MPPDILAELGPKAVDYDGQVVTWLSPAQAEALGGHRRAAGLRFLPGELRKSRGPVFRFQLDGDRRGPWKEHPRASKQLAGLWWLQFACPLRSEWSPLTSGGPFITRDLGLACETMDLPGVCLGNNFDANGNTWTADYCIGCQLPIPDDANNVEVIQHAPGQTFGVPFRAHVSSGSWGSINTATDVWPTDYHNAQRFAVYVYNAQLSSP